MKIELDPEQLDIVMVRELTLRLECFKSDYEDRLNNQESHYAIFALDRDEDLKLIKKHIKACKLLLEYYGKGEE